MNKPKGAPPMLAILTDEGRERQRRHMAGEKQVCDYCGVDAERAEQAEAALVLAETALHQLVETGLASYDTRRQMAREALAAIEALKPTPPAE